MTAMAQPRRPRREPHALAAWLQRSRPGARSPPAQRRPASRRSPRGRGRCRAASLELLRLPRRQARPLAHRPWRAPSRARGGRRQACRACAARALQARPERPRSAPLARARGGRTATTARLGGELRLRPLARALRPPPRGPCSGRAAGGRGCGAPLPQRQLARSRGAPRRVLSCSPACDEAHDVSR